MHFSREELLRFAEWEPAFAGFDREGPRTAGSLVHSALAAFGRTLALHGVEELAIEDGGLSNYAASFCSFVETPAGPLASRTEIEGSTVYFSLLAPYAVIGHASLVRFERCRTLPHIRLSDVIDPGSPATKLDQILVEAVLATPYRLLTPEEVATPLPEGIAPFEYCFDEEPWDRVFHVMFSNTD